MVGFIRLASKFKQDHFIIDLAFKSQMSQLNKSPEQVAQKEATQKQAIQNPIESQKQLLTNGIDSSNEVIQTQKDQLPPLSPWSISIVQHYQSLLSQNTISSTPYHKMTKQQKQLDNLNKSLQLVLLLEQLRLKYTQQQKKRFQYLLFQQTQYIQKIKQKIAETFCIKRQKSAEYYLQRSWKQNHQIRNQNKLKAYEESLAAANAIFEKNHSSVILLTEKLDGLMEKGKEMKERKQRMAKELKQLEKEYRVNSVKNKQLKGKYKSNRETMEMNEDRFISLLQDKQVLTGEIQNIIGNIRVYLRIKPYAPKEKQKDQQILQSSKFFEVDGNTIQFTLPKNEKSENYRRQYSFMFEDIFTDKSTQQDVFNEFDRIVESVLVGKNVCIFAYGQTGSGKTHTMQGTKENPGIIPRSLRKLFIEISEAEKEAWSYQIFVECVEIYNDDVRELLPQKLTPVNSIQQIEKLINVCNSNRSVAETTCNQRSSRSHLIFTIKLNATNEFQNMKRNSYLSLVDLAGSQRVDLSNVQGNRLKETKHINGSLTQLGLVIQSLAQKRTHVPFRNSKLTTVLEPVLSGDSKTIMMVCISPLLASWNQTVSSLAFGEKVKKVTVPVKEEKEKETKETRDTEGDGSDESDGYD